MKPLLALTVCLTVAQVATPPVRIVPAPPREGVGLISKTMTGLDAQSFASALARAGHKAGFIMPISERQGFVPPDSGAMLTLDEAVAEFTARGQYRVARTGDTLVFRHVKTPADVAGVLEVPRQQYPIKGTFSLALYDIVLRGVARYPMGAIRTKEAAAGPECPVEQELTVPAGTRTAIQTMNALIGRTKGVAWLVRYGQPGEKLRLQIGYVCGNGVWSALSAPGW